MTAEQISSSYDSSIVVRRWGGTVLDFLLFIGLGVLAAQAPDPGAAIGLLALLLLVPVYYVLLEARYGATLGKLICGVRVVDSAGGRPGLAQTVLRTLSRLVEVNPILAGGIPAGVIVLGSKTRQRLGDRLAKTFVLKSEDVARVGEYEPQAAIPTGGTDWLGPSGRSVWAIAAGYLGLCSILLIPAPFAVWTGIQGLREIARKPGLGGKGRAIFGIVAGSLFSLLGLVIIVSGLLQH